MEQVEGQRGRVVVPNAPRVQRRRRLDDPMTTEQIGSLPSPAVVAADVDGTLVHSRRRVPEPTGMRVVEVYDGRDVGFVEPEAWDLLDRLQRLATVVPFTARTRRQYERIDFPRRPRVAVLCGGATVLVDGEVDPVWAEHVDAATAATGTTAADVAARMTEVPTTEEPRVGDDRFAYVRVAPEADVAGLAAWCRDRRWNLVHQDGRIYAHPDGVTKAAPLGRIADIVGSPVGVAMGDGLMDRDLLDSAPIALTPSLGPLWVSGWRGGSSVDGFGPGSTTLLLRAALDATSPETPLPTKETHVS